MKITQIRSTSHLATALLATATLAATCLGCANRGPTNLEKPPRPVTVMVLKKTDPRRVDHVAGSVASWKTEEIGFEVSGRVTFVIEAGNDVTGKNFDDFGNVPKDPTLLAELDPERYQLAVKRAQADVDAIKQQRESLLAEINEVLPAQRKSYEAQQTLARIEVDRNRSLVAQNAAAKRDLDIAVARFDSSVAEITRIDAQIKAKQAELKSLEANQDQLQQTLEEAKLDVEDCRLFSPYPGQVADVHVIPGAVVEKGQRVVTAQLMNPIVIEFEVSRQTLRRINYRDSLTITIPMADGTDHQQDATVYITDPVADAETRTFTVTLLSANEKVVAEVPDGVNKDEIGRTDNIWRVVPRTYAGRTRMFVDEQSIQKDAEGAFLWRITNRNLGTVASETSPLLKVEKVRVAPGTHSISFLDLYKFQEFTLAEGEKFDVLKDLVTGGVRYPKGQDAATWMGDQVLFDRTRWLLRPGDLVGVDISGRAAAKGYYVPINAIQETAGRTYVFVVESSESEDRVQQVEVKTFDVVKNMRRIEPVTSDKFNDGVTQIVGDGALFLSDDERVNVVRKMEIDQ